MMRTVAVLSAITLIISVAQCRSTEGVVQWDTQRKRVKSKLSKRDDVAFEEVITNERSRGGYFSTCEIGTPPQVMTLQLDTGSSDTWVPIYGAEVCQGSVEAPRGCDLGKFHPTESSTYEEVGHDDFSIRYLDGRHANGDYFQDTFQIAGAVLDNLTIGLGIDTDIPYGLVGIGYAANVAVVEGKKSAYHNLPVSMVEAGLINTNAYSLWLNDMGSSTGSILFGGVDTEKYVGDLITIDVLTDPRTNDMTAFIVPLTSIEAHSPTGDDILTADLPVSVILDSGTTMSYLPTELAEQIWKEAGAVYTGDVQRPVIPCDMRASMGHFVFGFAGPDGPRIQLSMDELVLDLILDGLSVFSSGPYKGREACEFGIQNLTSDLYLLGDTFLRSAYVVYDLMNNNIALAATDFNSTSSNVVPFPSLGSTIPNAIKVSDFGEDLVVSSSDEPSYDAAPGFLDLGSTVSGSESSADTRAVFRRSQTIIVCLSLAWSIIGAWQLLATSYS